MPAREIFAFVTLGNDAMPVACGRFVHDDSGGTAIGRWVYAKSYLGRPEAVALDPVALPLQEREFSTMANRGFFGILLDAMPDDWGRKLRAAVGLPIADFDLLLGSSRDRFGALRFGVAATAPIPDEPVPQLVDVSRQLLDGIAHIDQRRPLSAAERDAILALGGNSAGGARPKLTVWHQHAPWLLKLPRAVDSWDHVRVEAAMLDLARLAGIDVPQHELIEVMGNDALLVRRFDRATTPIGVARYRVASARTVFCADDAYYRSSPFGSYPRLAREFARWSDRPQPNRQALFRRLAFNCLTGISDDHERNHALVAPGRDFSLSPAFDLTPSVQTTQRRQQALIVGAHGAAATRENMLTALGAFAIEAEEANTIIDDVKSAVTANWRACFAQRGVVSADVAQLASGFDPAYFETTGAGA